MPADGNESSPHRPREGYPGPATTRLGRLDHIFVKGLAAPDSAAAGTVLDVGGASDHLAVWAVGILR